MRRVAVLGTGIMGAGMARSLLRSGLDVIMWNRSRGRAAPLAADGAQVAGTAAGAVAVMTAALPAAPDGVLWAQTSTVSLHDAGVRLPALASRYGARYVDAPVLGTRQPAEEGKLLVLAAAPGPLRDPVTPLFDAIAARTVWVSERPGDGTRLKLVANSWVGTIVAATAQAIAFAEALGLDPQVFPDTLRGGAVDTPFLHLKGQAMIAGEFPPSFTVDGAVKDTGLIAATMRESGTDATLMLPGVPPLSPPGRAQLVTIRDEASSRARTKTRRSARPTPSWHSSAGARRSGRSGGRDLPRGSAKPTGSACGLALPVHGRGRVAPSHGRGRHGRTRPRACDAQADEAHFRGQPASWAGRSGRQRCTLRSRSSCRGWVAGPPAGTASAACSAGLAAVAAAGPYGAPNPVPKRPQRNRRQPPP